MNSLKKYCALGGQLMKLDEYPKILIVSDAAWRDDNNIGNTFSNLFKGWPKDKIAMIYARPNLPDTVVCERFFQISEVRLLKQMLNKNIKVGISINQSKSKDFKAKYNTEQKDEQNGKMLYSFFLKYRWNVFLFARELLWSLSNWRTTEFNKFIDDFNPHIVLSLADSSLYISKIQQYVIQRSNAKSVIYFVDDVYSNKRLNLSPLFWLNRQRTRKGIRSIVSRSDLVYTIIDKQKEEYDEHFKINSKILNKGGDFTGKFHNSSETNQPIKLVFTGNITSGRWKTLGEIGAALDRINKNGIKAKLEIYTKNEIYGQIEKVFHESKSIDFKGSIEASRVREVQNNADVLVHVESMELKERLDTRLSFSTKLVDYFERGKCILAVGGKDAASIDYLLKERAAVVALNKEDIFLKLNEIIYDNKIISEQACKAWECGKRNHQNDIIHKSLYRDLKSLLEED